MRYTFKYLLAFALSFALLSCEKELLDEETLVAESTEANVSGTETESGITEETNTVTTEEGVVEEAEADTKETQAEVEAAEEASYDDDVMSADEAFVQNAVVEECIVDPFRRNFPSCASVKVSKKGYPIRTVINYGEGCESRNGKVRKGKIVIIDSAPMMEKGATRTIKYKKYSVDGVKVRGKKVITNTGENAAGNTVFAVTGRIRRIKKVDGVKIVRIRKISKEREFIAGDETCTKRDDEFIVTGGAKIIVKRIKGEEKTRKVITREIAVPLHRKRGCRKPISGVVVITKANGNVVKMDYGNGECDTYATLTKADGTTKVVDLAAKRNVETITEEEANKIDEAVER